MKVEPRSAQAQAMAATSNANRPTIELLPEALVASLPGVWVAVAATEVVSTALVMDEVLLAVGVIEPEAVAATEDSGGTEPDGVAVPVAPGPLAAPPGGELPAPAGGVPAGPVGGALTDGAPAGGAPVDGAPAGGAPTDGVPAGIPAETPPGALGETLAPPAGEVSGLGFGTPPALAGTVLAGGEIDTPGTEPEADGTGPTGTIGVPPGTAGDVGAGAGGEPDTPGAVPLRTGGALPAEPGGTLPAEAPGAVGLGGSVTPPEMPGTGGPAGL